MRNYAENGELCGIVRRTENCAISHSPHLNVASDSDPADFYSLHRHQDFWKDPLKYDPDRFNKENIQGKVTG